MNKYNVPIVEQGQDGATGYPFIKAVGLFKDAKQTLEIMHACIKYSNWRTRYRLFIYDIKILDAPIKGDEPATIGFIMILTPNHNNSMIEFYRKTYKKRYAEKMAEYTTYNKQAKIYNKKSICERWGLFNRPLKQLSQIEINAADLDCNMGRFVKQMAVYGIKINALKINID